MSRHLRSISLVCLLTGLAWPMVADAQVLGTFRWQFQPFCNVVSLVVTQNGSIFTLDGFDDQCGAATRAPVTGTAVFNPSGTVEFGLNIVVTPGAAPIHVAVALNVATLGGTWRDSTGATGNFVFTPGNGTGGNARPVPATLIPSQITLLADGGLLAEGVFGAGSIPQTGAGSRMMWYPKKAAFRAGRVDATAWDDANIGSESVAFNKNSRATATFSAAFGDSTLASGARSTAMGSFTTASGPASTSLGQNTTASGAQALAAGDGTTASGGGSFAIGLSNVASGLQSVAMGLNSSATTTAAFAMGDAVAATGLTSVALGFHASATAGGFAFADRSTTAVFPAFDNQFGARAVGGFGFYTAANLTAGVELAPGASSWSSVSDVNMKENFRDLQSDDVLAKIARMPIREWNYKAQDAAIRHIGPTAQDFYTAFGLGENPLRITTIDADGIALRAIQALLEEVTALRQRVAQLEARDQR